MWEMKPISEVAAIVNGGTPKSAVSMYWDGEVQWLTPKDMGKLTSELVSCTSRKISSEGLANSSAKLVPSNSVILSTRAPIGHLAINEVPMSFNQGCRGLVPKSNLDTRYLFYFLKANVDLLNDLGTGTTFKELSKKALASIPVPLPPLDEQKRIVAILDQAFEGIDKAITNTEQNLKNARELFDSYLNNIFAQKGDRWLERKLGDRDLLKIVDGDRGKSYPKKSDFADSGFCLFLNTKNVRPDGFNFDNLMFISEERDNLLRKGKLQRRDVVLTTRGTIGNIALYDQDVPYHNIRINSGMLIFRPNEKVIMSEYLFEVLRSQIVKSQISNHVSGAAQPQLPIKTLVNFSIPVPIQLETQSQIVSLLKTWHAETNRLKEIYLNKFSSLKELKQSLLQKAFSGELTTVAAKEAVRVA